MKYLITAILIATVIIIATAIGNAIRERQKLSNASKADKSYTNGNLPLYPIYVAGPKASYLEMMSDSSCAIVGDTQMILRLLITECSKRILLIIGNDTTRVPYGDTIRLSPCKKE